MVAVLEVACCPARVVDLTAPVLCPVRLEVLATLVAELDLVVDLEAPTAGLVLLLLTPELLTADVPAALAV